MHLRSSARSDRSARPAYAALVVVLACGLTACSDDNATTDPTPGSSSSSAAPLPSESPSPTSSAGTSPAASPGTTAPSAGASDGAGVVIEVEIEGDDIKPNGDRVEVNLGEQVTFEVKADRDGELHVHSSPEQELEYHKGQTTLRLTVKNPGVVEVEDHVADKVLVSLEVS